jgi:hypothetical protein
MKTKRLLSLLLCACMVITLLPAVAPTAYAAGTGAITLGTSGIAGGGTNWVYYGNYNSNPIRWRVLNENGGNGGTYTDSIGNDIDSADAMFLLSEYLLTTAVAFGDNNTWSASTLKTWMTSNIYNGSNVFTSIEKTQILETTTTGDSGVGGSSAGPYLSACNLDGDTMFALSADEATRSEYGFDATYSTTGDSSGRVALSGGASGSAGWWWLRSPDAGSTNDAGVVLTDGSVRSHNVSSYWGARPAFNLNLSSVLFASAAEGGKSSGAVGAGALNSVSATTPSAWKLTLEDSTRGFSAATTAVDTTANTVTVAYSGATVGTNEYISAVIIDSSDNIKYYGRLKNITATADATGTVQIDLSSVTMAATDTLYVFSEQYNGGTNDNTKLTDYASALQTVSTTGYNVTYSLANLTTSGAAYVENASDYTATLSAGTDYLLPASISVTVGGTAATLAGSATDADTAGEYYYDASTGVVTVAKVSDAVVITAAGIAKTYTVSASPSSLDFGSLTEGYTTAPGAQTVTITNNGSSAATGYTVTGGGTDFNVTYTSSAIAAGGTGTFTVQPITGLAAGTHTAILSMETTEGTTATVSLSFTVTAKSSSGGGGSSTTYYTITATAGTGGSISPSGSASVAYGNDKTYTIAPNDGYEIEDVLVDGVSVGAVSTYTFENVKKAHTITASFKEIETADTETVNPFTDVETDDWFYENVLYVYENGLMTGTGSDMFNPDGTMTRAMIVTVLYRMSGDTGSYTNTFSDVPSGEWYEQAAAWAAANGITSGTGDDSFSPNAEITREQLAVMLYNYAKLKGFDTTQGGMAVREFDDYDSISSYASEAMAWAVSVGLIQGSGNMLNPQSSATRAEVATMLQRFCENVAGQ